ncbi:MAG TPA: trimethylamine methyltransferase family protein [Armatimonadota bacterium]|nr:trimethylamine methyltransferase family protein [Armatimonadota bacterium]
MGPLTQDDLQRMDSEAIRILGEMGVWVDHDEVRAALVKAGAEETGQAKVLRLPEGLVRDSIAVAPKTVRLSTLSGEDVDLTANGPTVFWGGNALHITTLGERKEMTSESLGQLVRLYDRLEHVHAPVSTSMVDFPPTSRDFVGFRVLAQNSSKHLRPCVFTPAGPLTILDMANVVAPRPYDQHPVFSLGYTCVSPLRWSNAACDLFYLTSGKRIPMMINVEPLAGATASVTLAGSIAQGNAEALAGFIITQTLEPGRPCVYNMGFAHPFDMRSLISLTGAAECGLHAASGAQIAQYYDLPSASWMSTESCVPDAQAGLEKVVTGMQHALAGVNIIWGIGQLDSQQSLSMEMAVIDNDIAGQLLRAQKGVPVNDEMLAMPVLDEVGIGGTFMTHDHTLDNYRDQLHYPDVIHRGERQPWEEAGGKWIHEVAHDRAMELLAEEREPHLTEDQEREMLAIEARRLEEIR